MKTNENVYDKIISTVKPGEHLCCIYGSKREQLSIVIPFITSGLEKGEKCFYIVDENTVEDIKSAFKKLKKDILKYIESGQFTFLTSEDAYIKGGYFDPDRMIELLRECEGQAMDEGYPSLRVTGEMTWVFSNLPGVDRLMEYEAKLNYFFPGSSVSAICQYNERRFDAAVLLDVLRTHPKIVLGEDLCENFYYIPPDEFLAREKGKITRSDYIKAIENILQRNRDEKRLKEELLKLEKMNRIMIGREMRIIELKKEVNELLVQSGRNKKYKI